MRRRFNYTGRKRIQHGSVLITIEESSPPSFDAILDLDEYGFPADAKVILEAYRQRYYRRFDYGTVAENRPPQDRSLSGASGLDLPLFRVKVIDTSDEKGRILGMADQLSPEEETGTDRKTIFPVFWSEEIGNAIWRVNYTVRARPTLELNNRIEGLREAVRVEPDVRALIFPAAVREVLLYMAFTTETLTSAARDDWEGEWLQFISKYYPEEPPADEPSRDDLHRWVEQAVDGFCDHFNPRGLFEKRGGTS